MSLSIQAVADLILYARRSGTHFSSSDLAEPLDSAADAYAVQDLVAKELWRDFGGRPTAWKAGAGSPDAVPTAAPMSPPVHASPTTLSAGKLGLMIVEMELAYRFGCDLPPRAGLDSSPYTLDEVSDAVESIHAAIEIVDSRLADQKTAPSLLKLADDLSHGAFILGEGVQSWRKIDPRRQLGELHINGKVHERFQIAHPLGNPAVLLPWLAEHLSLRAGGAYGGVKAGDIVTTGSLNQLVRCKAGDVVSAEFPGIGAAIARFVE